MRLALLLLLLLLPPFVGVVDPPWGMIVDVEEGFAAMLVDVAYGEGPLGVLYMLGL